MIFGAFTGYEGTLYKILLVVHIAAVVAAFGPMLLQQSWMKKAAAQSKESAVALVETGQTALRSSLPALVVAVLAGIGLVLASDGVIGFDQPWISASFTTVFVLIVIGAFILRPAFTELLEAVRESGPSSDAAKAVFLRVNAASGFFHLGLLILLVLMLFQPGR